MVLHSSTVRHLSSPHMAYHPQANGLVEKFHRQLKTALITRLTGANWVDELPWVLFGIRTTPKEDINFSTAELVYGSPLTVSGDFIPGTNEPRTLLHCFPGSDRLSVNSILHQRHNTVQHHNTCLVNFLIAYMCLIDVIRTDHH